MSDAPSTPIAVPHADVPVRRKRPAVPFLRIIAVAVALAGWWISADLLRVTVGGQATIGLLQRSCGQSAGGVSPCLSVLRSPQASIGGGPGGRGIPWAALGAGYFAFMAAWFGLVGRVSNDRWPWYLLILLTAALGAYHSIGFLRVMAFELRQWCGGCVAAHVCNFVLLAILLAQFPARRSGGPAGHPGFALGAASVLCGWLLIMLHVSLTREMIATAGAGLLTSEYQKLVSDPNFARWRHGIQPQVEIPSVGAAVEGAPDAPNSLVVFSDFQCPRCRELHFIVRELLKRHPGRLRVQYRHFPLDPACNAHARAVVHPLACRAAAAAEAVRLAAGAEAHLAFRDLLYQRQGDLGLNRYEEWAIEAGASAEAFLAALDSPAVGERLRADAALGNQLGVATVPAVFLNGRRLEFWNNEAFWDELLGMGAAASRPGIDRTALP